MSLTFFNNSFFKKNNIYLKKQIKFLDKLIFDKNSTASFVTLLNWSARCNNKFVIENNLPGILLSHYSYTLFSSKFWNILRFKFMLIQLLQSSIFLKEQFIYNFSVFTSGIKPVFTLSFINFMTFSSTFLYNVNLLTWFDSTKQLFDSSFLTLTFKTSRRNVFLIISSQNGSILWKKSAGNVGFRSKHKKSPEALKKLVDSLILFLRAANVPGLFIFRFFFIKSLDKNKFDALCSLLSRNEIYYTYLIYDVRSPHGYMRLRKKRRL